MKPYSTHIEQKAIALVNQGRVSRLPGIGGGVKMWQVAGDGDTYLVVTRVGPNARSRCSCKAGQNLKFCSHQLAGLIAHKQEENRTNERNAA